MQNYDRLSIVVSLVLLGLALMLLIRLPTRIVQTELFGSPVEIVLSGRLVMALFLSTLTAVGVEYIMRAHPEFGPEGLAGYSFPFWILPTGVTLAASWLTPALLQYGIPLWIGGLAVAAVALSAVIVAEYRTIDRKDSFYTPARLFLNVVAYLSGLVLFSLVYGAKLRSAISASSVTVLAALLALSLLRAGRAESARTWIYSAICGLVLGEATWALNYWGVGGLAGGGLLVLIFYFFSGLAQQRLLNRLGRPVLIEFGIVGAVGLFLLATQGALSW
ncbi:MAG: DUF5656 family protein [Ardenticatenaceae bacterium]